MSIKIALIGNPNCGKTTMFNTLTNNKQKVGNWTGVTVEEKSGNFIKNKQIEIVDLPGIYSLNPFSPDEKVSSDFIKNNKIDAVINVISAINLEHSLYLTIQLLELNIPIIVAITMVDVLEKIKSEIDYNMFAKIFSCDVFKIIKNDETSHFKIVEKIVEKTKLIKSAKIKQTAPHYSPQIEDCLTKIENTILNSNKFQVDNNPRWVAINLLENIDQKLVNINLNENEQLEIKNLIKNLNNGLNQKINIQKLLINERYNFINNNIKKILIKNSKEKPTISDKIDNILTNKWFSIPAFILIISIIYFISIPLIGKPASEWLDETLLKTWIIPATKNFLTNISIHTWLKNLICDGIISGVGSILVFVPQLTLLFFLLCFLEECGYMSRITFITDKILNNFGLCGQSIISFLVSSSCGINGIIATKTITNKSKRLITMATTTFIPCSAKIPVIASISSLFLTHSWIIAPISYLICILAILICGVFLKNKNEQKLQNNNFFMEISPYQLPPLKHLITDTFSNIKSFIAKAATVILIASVLIWVATNIGFYDGRFCMVQANQSILAQTSKLLTPFFKPLGFSNWQTVAASISGLFAKENIVNTLKVIAASDINNNSSIANLFNSQAAAFSFLIFNLLCAPCCVAITAIFKQTNSIKLTLKITVFQTIVAWIFSAITFLIARTLFKL